MKKPIKQILILVIIAILFIIFYFSFFNNENSTSKVNAMETYIGNISKTIDLSGSVNSSDYEEISVEANLEVLNTYVKENDLVESGQLLADLDSTELLISLEKAKITLEQLKSDLNLEKNGTSNSEIEILKNSLSRGKEEFSRIKVDLELAVENLEKSKTLYEENAISKAEYDKQITVVKDLESSLKTAELNYNDADSKYTDYFGNNKQNIETIERQIKTALLDIESLNKKIENNKIYSTIPGVVTEFTLKSSRETTLNDKIIICNTNSYEFVAKVAQEDAVLVKEGQKATVEVKGISKPYDGIVSNVGQTAEIDSASGSKTPKIEVTIKISEPDNSLASGFDGDASVEIESKDNVLLVKNECIKNDAENKEFLFVVENGIAKKIYVETGLSDGYQTIVLKGISEGTIVILNPPEELTDGLKVETIREEDLKWDCLLT